MIEVVRYKNSERANWNDFLTKSRIDTFLFNRDFMDYHSDRFNDCSFMIYRKGKLEAILPGNINQRTYYSHQGLTYGGLVTSSKMTTSDILLVFKLVNEKLKQLGVAEIIYKPTPNIYQLIPAQEDIYALFRLGAIKIGCNISSTILKENKIAFIESRKSGIRKAKKGGIRIDESQDLVGFWHILENNLTQTHGARPVHNIYEISNLKAKFPDHIKLFTASNEKGILGGCLLFIMKRIVHVQYISANEEGKAMGAIDLLFDKLINEIFSHVPIFDFGQSTEQLGNYLNENLIFQKEGFGGRGIVYEIYKYKI